MATRTKYNDSNNCAITLNFPTFQPLNRALCIQTTHDARINQPTNHESCRPKDQPMRIPIDPNNRIPQMTARRNAWVKERGGNLGKGSTSCGSSACDSASNGPANQGAPYDNTEVVSNHSTEQTKITIFEHLIYGI